MASTEVDTGRAYALARFLDATVAHEWDHSQALAARMTAPGNDGEVEVAVKRLEAHPLTSLMGMKLDEKWVALAVSSLGRAFSSVPGGRARPERVRITYAVGFDDEVSIVRRQHTDELQHLRQAVGLVPDLLRGILATNPAYRHHQGE